MRLSRYVPTRLKQPWIDRSVRVRRQLEQLQDDGPRANRLAGRILLKAIRRYQQWSMADGRQLCKLGPERHCSRMAARAAAHLPAMQAILAIVGLLTVHTLRLPTVPSGAQMDSICCDLEKICGL
jgi:hypothetical protein